jgi:predicted flap endonuclease-1-like 5' DNA nuclease
MIRLLAELWALLAAAFAIGAILGWAIFLWFDRTEAAYEQRDLADFFGRVLNRIRPRAPIGPPVVATVAIADTPPEPALPDDEVFAEERLDPARDLRLKVQASSLAAAWTSAREGRPPAEEEGAAEPPASWPAGKPAEAYWPAEIRGESWIAEASEPAWITEPTTEPEAAPAVVSSPAEPARPDWLDDIDRDWPFEAAGWPSPAPAREEGWQPDEAAPAPDTAFAGVPPVAMTPLADEIWEQDDEEEAPAEPATATDAEAGEAVQAALKQIATAPPAPIDVDDVWPPAPKPDAAGPGEDAPPDREAAIGAAAAAAITILTGEASAPTEAGTVDERSEAAPKDVPLASPEKDIDNVAAPLETDTVASTAAAGGSADAPATRPPREDIAPGSGDDLKQIRGIGKANETRLHKLGIHRLAQIAAWNEAEQRWMSEQFGFAGRVEREDWVGQSQRLLKGRTGRQA